MSGTFVSATGGTFNPLLSVIFRKNTIFAANRESGWAYDESAKSHTRCPGSRSSSAHVGKSTRQSQFEAALLLLLPAQWQ